MHQRATLSLDTAQDLMGAVFERARGEYRDRPIACAVVGSDGELIAFGAQDNCGMLPRRLAARKAYTSVILRRSTTEVKASVVKGDLDLAGLNDTELAATPGGAPILVNGLIVGAIGVSGLAASEDANLAEGVASQFQQTAG